MAHSPDPVKKIIQNIEVLIDFLRSVSLQGYLAHK